FTSFGVGAALTPFSRLPRKCLSSCTSYVRLEFLEPFKAAFRPGRRRDSALSASSSCLGVARGRGPAEHRRRQTPPSFHLAGTPSNLRPFSPPAAGTRSTPPASAPWRKPRSQAFEGTAR